jgi:hypothetical protein
VRGATAEFTALAVLPFLFLAIDAVLERSSALGVAALAITTAAVVLSHVLSVVLVAPFAAVYVVARLVRRERRWAALGRAVAGVALGAALSAFYWLPAMREAAALSPERLQSQLSDYYSPFHHFVYAVQLLDPKWGFGSSMPGLADGMSFQLGLLSVAALAASLLAIPLVGGHRRRFVLLALALAAGAVALTHEVSSPIYAAIPQLGVVQFPWRFLGPATLFLSVAGAGFASVVVERQRALGPVLVGVTASLALLLSTPQRAVLHHLPLPDERAIQAAVELDPFTAKFGNGDEYLPRDASLAAASTMLGGPTPRGSDVEVAEVRAGRTDVSFEVRSERGGGVVVPWHDFPGWRATLDGHDWPLAPDRDGLLSLAVPEGRHSVRVRFGTTAPRVLGWCLAAAALAILGALVLRARVRVPGLPSPRGAEQGVGRRARRCWRALLAGDRWTAATAALLVAGVIVVLATFRQYGITTDERLQAEVGRNAVAWFASAGADGRALTGGSAGDLHLYGALFEAAADVAASAVPLDPFELRHLLNALVGLAGVAGVALLARRLGGPRAGFLAAALLVTTPFWWGHGFANSKDVPFAAAYVWFLLALLRACDALPRPGLRAVAEAGAALGIALALRPGGLVLLLPMTAGILAVRLLPFLRPSAPGRLRALGAAALRLGAILAIGWGGMLALWPYGLRNPVAGPIAAAVAARQFLWRGLVRFAGEWVWSTDLPRSYAPRWFLATLPESWFVISLACAAAAVVAWRARALRPTLDAAWLDRALVAAAGFGPIAAAVAVRPVLYDGVRHLLFAVPALAALAGWGFSAALERLPRRVGQAALGATAVLAAVAVVDAVRLHPYQYLYFNRAVAGGLEGASRDWELDYWGAAGGEAMEWTMRNVVSDGERPLSVATTVDPIVASHWVESDGRARARFVFDPTDDPDLRLASTRWFQHRASGRVLHVVERMGVPLLYVLQTFADPLVLEGGDEAVALSPSEGWSAMPRYKEGDLSGAYTLLRLRGEPAEGEAWIETAARGGIPSDADLRARVVELARSRLGAGPGALDAEPVNGPQARGWMVAGTSGSDLGAAIAARVGDDVAVFAFARCYGDGEGARRELRDWIRNARLAAPGERRPP